MKIISLVDNVSNRENIGFEHGLSMYIEHKNKKLLFDMGQTDLFEENAKKLGIDLSEIDIAVLSHGHYDHGGGLGRFTELNRKARVYLNSFAFGDHYNAKDKYIGLDRSLSASERLVYVDDELDLGDGMKLFSCNKRIKHHDLSSFGLKLLENGSLVPDPFHDEQYLLIEEDGKKVLFSGCSHKGIMDIVDWFAPDVLVGGFHFSKLPLDNALAEYSKYLASCKTEFYTCHCTGVEQYEFMKKYIPSLSYLSCGDELYL